MSKDAGELREQALEIARGRLAHRTGALERFTAAMKSDSSLQESIERVGASTGSLLMDALRDVGADLARVIDQWDATDDPARRARRLLPPLVLTPPAVDLSQSDTARLRRPGTKWTDKQLKELAACRQKHGTKAAAQKFGISQPRVRQLLPTTPKRVKAHDPFGRARKGKGAR